MAVKGKAVAPKAEVAQDVKVTLLGAYQGVLDEARKEFEAGVAAQLADWKNELARVKEEDVYQFNIAKRDREDALKAELATRVASVTERETKVKEREVAVGDAEKTIAGLQATVDGISAIQVKAEAIGFNKGKAEAEKEAAATVKITEAQTNAKVEILESRIAALQATVTTQVTTIENLQAELKAANARVQEIANNAVNAAGQSKVTVQNAPTASR